MFVYHKQCARDIMPAEYYVIPGCTQEDAAIEVFKKNKFEEGPHLLKFILKHYDDILESIPSTDESFYALEEQDNLKPFTSKWWEPSDIKVPLSKILELGLQYESITPKQVKAAVLKPTSEWIPHLFPVLNFSDL